MFARTTAIAALTIVTGSAFAQVDYNRSLRAGDISISPAPTPDEVIISVKGRIANQRRATTNLSSVVRVFVDGELVGVGELTYIRQGGQTCNGSCPTGDCSANGTGSECSDFAPLGGQGCACDVVVTPGGGNTHWTARVRPGSVIGVEVEPLPGSMPEMFTADDVVFIPVEQPCDPDMNQDGNIDQDDVLFLISVIGGGDNLTGIDPDFNRDGNADQDDVLALIQVIGGGDCP
ncbi:MAG: hypothetical protein DYG92_05905 [Leptolyngbya sp. PLA1]|nr:hypothetical protein [Leptolyngbya sp. PLA1]